MKKQMLISTGCGMATVAWAVFAPLAWAASTVPADNTESMQYQPVMSEEGTIPAARPEPPYQGADTLGPQGPVRSEAMPQSGTDPSIRDQNPLTVDGLWETLPGNAIATPHSQ